MKKGIFLLMTALITAGLCPSSAMGGWFGSREPEQPPFTEKELQTAVENGDLEAVKRMIKQKPEIVFNHPVRIVIPGYEPFKTYMVCLAAAAKQDELVKYLINNYPVEHIPQRTYTMDIWQKNVDCGGHKNCRYCTPLQYAIAFGHGSTTRTLIALHTRTARTENGWEGYDVEYDYFVEIAKNVKDGDTASLKRIVAALMDKGLNPSRVVSPSYQALQPNEDFKADSFFFAAQSENYDFITVLRDELIKRKQMPKVHLQKVEKIKLTLNEKELRQSAKEMEIRRAQVTKELKAMKEIQLLKEYGVLPEIDVKFQPQ